MKEQKYGQESFSITFKTSPQRNKIFYTCLGTGIHNADLVKRKEMKRMYWITGTLGVVFLMAPFLLGYSNSVIAATTSLIVGFAITFLSLLEGVLRERGWEDVVISIFGLLAIVAPFALGYSTHMPATVTDIITGSVTMIIGYSMYARLKNI